VQDLGFLAFTLPQVEICMPTKKPRGQERTLEQRAANQALHSRRLRIEHVHSSVKRCRIVKDRISAGAREVPFIQTAPGTVITGAAKAQWTRPVLLDSAEEAIAPALDR
jgi:hypothetical protein